MASGLARPVARMRVTAASVPRIFKYLSPARTGNKERTYEKTCNLRDGRCCHWGAGSTGSRTADEQQWRCVVAVRSELNHHPIAADSGGSIVLCPTRPESGSQQHRPELLLRMDVWRGSLLARILRLREPVLPGIRSDVYLHSAQRPPI